MRSRARLLGHPLRPILVVFPLALLPLLVVLDLVAWRSGAGAVGSARAWIAMAGLGWTMT